MASDLSFNITALDNASKTFVKMAEQVERLSKKVDQLDRKEASVNVDADTAKANAELDRTDRKADDLDGKNISLKVKVKGAAAAMAKVAGLTAATQVMARGMTSAASSSTLLVAALPIVSAAAVSAAGALGALASAVGVAGTGMLAFGIAAIGNIKKVNDVSDKIEALNEQLKQTGTSTHAAAQAQRAHSRAIQQASWAAADAARSVEDAERTLAMAQRDARMAQQALSQAREDAADSMRRLRFEVAGGAIAERQAVFDLRRARKELSDARQAESKDGSEKAAIRLTQAQIAYDRQALSLKRIQARNKELAEQQAEATRAGIEGSRQVAAAKQQILDANRRVAAAERALADARRVATRQQIRSQQAIADAALAVQRAQQQAGQQQAQLIAERTRLINSLTPAQNRLRKSIDGVSQAYQKFLDVTAQPVAEALTPWLQAVNPLLQALAPIVTEVAGAIRRLGETVRADIKDGFIGGFLTFLEGKVGGAVHQFGTIFLSMFRGITGILKAFWPLGQDLLSWLSGLMNRFARWANSPEGHRSMGNFMKLIRDVGPKVWEAIKNIAGGVWSLMKSFTKDGVGMLQVVGNFFSWMSEEDNAQRVKQALYGIAIALAAVGIALAISTGGLSLIIPLVAIAGGAIGFWFEEIKAAAVEVGKWFKWVFTEQIPEAARFVVAWVKQRFTEFVNFFKGIGRWFTGPFVGFFKSIGRWFTGPFVGFFQGIGHWFTHDFVGFFRGIGRWFTKDFVGFFRGIGRWFKDDFVGFFKDAWNNVLGTMGKGVNTVLRGVNWLIKQLNKIPGVNLPKIGLWDWGALTLASGGPVHGPGTGTSDSIPARLSNNEHVWTAEEVRKAGGHGRVAAMRKAAKTGALGFAEGGPVWKELWSVVNGRWPAAQLTSAYRPGDPGHHGQGEAIDVVGPMAKMFRGLAKSYPNATELIYSPLGAIFDGQRRGWYPNHYDHLHWAMAEMGGGKGIFGTIGGWFSSAWDFLKGLNPLDWFGNIWDGAKDMIRGWLPDGIGQFANVGLGLLQQAFGGIKNWVLDKIGFGGGGGGGGSPRVRKAVRGVASQYGWARGAQWNALDWLIQQESSWNPRADNPTSDAAGLFQKMTSIHGPVEPTAAGQARWGLGYISRRYGDPMSAKQFHMGHNWYDNGGILPPGLTLAYNGTGKNETVLTSEQAKSMGGPTNIDVKVFIGNEEFTNRIDTRIEVHERDSQRKIRAGRR